MSWVGDLLSNLTRQGVPMLSGKLYKKGFDDAVSGRPKKHAISSLKGHQYNEDRPELLKYVNFNLTAPYEEGYRDGLAQAQLDATRAIARGFQRED